MDIKYIADVLENILKTENMSEENRSAVSQLLQEISGQFNDSHVDSDMEYVAKRIIEKAIQRRGAPYEGAWIVSGNQYVTDGHRVMKITSPLLLRGLPESVKPPLTVPALFDETAAYTKKVLCPSIPKLKQQMQESLKNQGFRKLNYILFQLDEEIQVNAEYLLEALIATGAKNCRIKPEVSYILFESKECSVIVLPVHSTKKLPVGECYALYHETGGYSHGE